MNDREAKQVREIACDLVAAMKDVYMPTPTLAVLMDCVNKLFAVTYTERTTLNDDLESRFGKF